MITPHPQLKKSHPNKVENTDLPDKCEISDYLYCNQGVGHLNLLFKLKTTRNYSKHRPSYDIAAPYYIRNRTVLDFSQLTITSGRTARPVFTGTPDNKNENNCAFKWLMYPVISKRTKPIEVISLCSCGKHG